MSEGGDDEEKKKKKEKTYGMTVWDVEVWKMVVLRIVVDGLAIGIDVVGRLFGIDVVVGEHGVV